MISKRIVRLFLFFVSTAIAYGCGGHDISSPKLSGPVYTAHKTPAAPALDGILNEDCWQNAETVQLVISGDNRVPELPTNVRVLWDDTMLYIGFECRDTDAASTVTMRDGPVEEADYVSICIDADADTISYAVISIAPTGAMYDAYILSNREGTLTKVMRDWNCDNARVSVSVYGGGARPGTEDRFWTVEAAIPFTEMFTSPVAPPREGSVWRVNFFRREMAESVQFSAFSPTGEASVGKPSLFAWLKFGG